MREGWTNSPFAFSTKYLDKEPVSTTMVADTTAPTLEDGGKDKAGLRPREYGGRIDAGKSAARNDLTSARTGPNPRPQGGN